MPTKTIKWKAVNYQRLVRLLDAGFSYEYALDCAWEASDE